jgi:hypothetical protein
VTKKARLTLEQLHLSTRPQSTKDLETDLAAYQLPLRPSLLQALGELVAAGLIAQAGERFVPGPIGMVGDIRGTALPLWAVADRQAVHTLLTPPLPGPRSRLSPLSA